jgi:hypothetical protein
VRNEAGSECGALAGLKEGRWARGRVSWPRNLVTCLSAHSLVHGRRGEGGSDREGPWRRERGKGRSGQRLSNWRTGPVRQREKRAGEETGADRSAPLGSEREGRERGTDCR